MRDILLNVVPAMSRVDAYTTAAVLGAAAQLVASVVGMRREPAMFSAGAACFPWPRALELEPAGVNRGGG